MEFYNKENATPTFKSDGEIEFERGESKDQSNV